MKRLAIILLAVLVAGCSSTPYLDARFGFQIDSWSDWVLQSERPWTPSESETKLWLQAGLEWDRSISCPYVETMMSGPWDQAFIGCSMRFGKKFYIEPALVHQIDARTSEFLQTDQKQWQGHNPFMHLRVGYQINPAFRIGLATGKSLFQGAPFEKEEGNPDLYWTDLEIGVRFWGKHGMFSKEHLGES